MSPDLQFGLRVARTALAHPIEAVDRVRTWREANAPQAQVDLPDVRSSADDEMHAFIGVSGCTACASELAAVSESMARRLAASTYHDASTALAQAVWIATRHGRPDRVVETGVGQGVTTNCILSAMDANEHGYLTSIDLPPLSSRWEGSVAGAVDPGVRGRWRYVRGAIRRKLPDVLEAVGPLGLYVHDALHTYPSMKFEFASAWPFLEDGALLVADDIEQNPAFLEFAADKPHLILAQPDKNGAVGVLRKDARRD